MCRRRDSLASSVGDHEADAVALQALLQPDVHRLLLVHVERSGRRHECQHVATCAVVGGNLGGRRKGERLRRREEYLHLCQHVGSRLSKAGQRRQLLLQRVYGALLLLQLVRIGVVLTVQHHEAVALRALYDVQFVAAEVVYLHPLRGLHDVVTRDGPSHGHHIQRPTLFVHLLRHDARAVEVHLVFHKVAQIALEDAVANDVDSHESGRYDGYQKYRRRDAMGLLAPLGVGHGALKVHQSHAEIGGETDENRVDEEEIERAEEVLQVPLCEAEAGGAQRRHQRRGYRHTRYHVAFASGGYGDDACRASAESYQHVVERRRRASQQFALHLAVRRDQEIERRRRDADERRHGVVLESSPQKLDVPDTKSQSHPDDWAHERRDKHRADDDSRRVDVQSKRRDEDSQNQNPHVGAAKRHVAGDVFYRRSFVYLLRRETKVLLQ